MPFSSFEFIFAFLPIALAVHFLLGRARWFRAQPYWLVICSFAFCARSDLRFLFALLVSIAFNYAISQALARLPREAEKRRGRLLALAISANLFALGYFKYKNFFLDSLSQLLHVQIPVAPLWLPLGISFFTFQQISWLVSASYGDTKKIGLLHYILHISFFPKLIAGPIMNYDEWLPQFEQKSNRVLNLANFVPGLMLFCAGLFKKAYIADPLGDWVGILFSFAGPSSQPYFLEAWIAALGWSVQLYFDFSGYSDMAIGAALMLNITFPLNFFSPYKAKSMVDFWQRWHMTLSNFLKLYLFTPLAKQCPRSRSGQQVCLFITMTLCGVWHGAGWNYVIFGLMHGSFVVINHKWREYARALPAAATKVVATIARPLTLTCVAVAFVVFRAETLGGSLALIKGMAGLNGITLPDELAPAFGFLAPLGVSFKGIFHAENKLVATTILKSLTPPLLIALIAPNIHQLLRLQTELKRKAWWQWAPSPAWSVVFALVTGMGVVSLFSENKQFLYFQF